MCTINSKDHSWHDWVWFKQIQQRVRMYQETSFQFWKISILTHFAKNLATPPKVICRQSFDHLSTPIAPSPSTLCSHRLPAHFKALSSKSPEPPKPSFLKTEYAYSPTINTISSFVICLLTTTKKNTSISLWTSKIRLCTSSKSLHPTRFPTTLLTWASISFLALIQPSDHPTVPTNFCLSTSTTTNLRIPPNFRKRIGQPATKSKVSSSICSKIWGQRFQRQGAVSVQLATPAKSFRQSQKRGKPRLARFGGVELGQLRIHFGAREQGDQFPTDCCLGKS